MDTYTVRALTATDRAYISRAREVLTETSVPPSKGGPDYPEQAGMLHVTVEALLEVIERITRPAASVPLDVVAEPVASTETGTGWPA